MDGHEPKATREKRAACRSRSHDHLVKQYKWDDNKKTMLTDRKVPEVLVPG